MSQTVIGIFKNPAQAQEAKSYLLANGFTNQNIDVSNHNNQSEYGTDHEYGTNQTNENITEEGVGDRISNFFKNLFTDENEVSSHITAARTGTIVTVHADTPAEASHAAEALNEYGAIDVNDTDANYSKTQLASGNYETGFTDNKTVNQTDFTDNNNVNDASFTGNKNVNQTGFTDRSNVNETGSSDKINVIKEELQVGKQMVETGGVRLRSRIVERPVEQSIRLREEHVNVERNFVDRPASDADFANFKEGTIELTESAETPLVTKNARVVEEVSLGKEVTERNETIKDTVRHTEVDTENLNVNNNRKDKI